MRVTTWIAYVCLISSIATGQGLTSVCHQFNGQSLNPGLPSIPFAGSGTLDLLVTAPVGGAFNGVSLYLNGFGAAQKATLALYASAGGVATGSPITSADSQLSGGWCTFQTPEVAVVAGVPYVLRFSGAVPGTVLSVAYDPAGSTAIPYALVCGASFTACNFFPSSGALPVVLRWRSSACVNTALADAAYVGWTCPSAPSFWATPNLNVTAPVLGTQAFATWAVAQAGDFHLFWSIGHAASSVPLGPPACLSTFLDLASVQLLAGLGLEPLLTTPSPGFFASGAFLLPNDPALTGQKVAVQGVFTSPSSPAQFSRSAVLTLGY
ncbi:MAG TPA: hypothetical protein VEI02_12405 [Planctomycetota bacterium]|nr:hypothetical protein [Planctomycetota bacterium]